METKHTPGPWERYGFRIESESGYYVADVIDSNGFGENKANALLIAAAPELLTCLIAIKSADVEGLAHIDIDAAITKAVGR